MVALSSATLKAGSETTSRSFANQVRRYVNVKGFGALGNGTDDDTTKIQAAIDWVATGDRGTLYFPRGTYLISSAIELFDNGDTLNIEGEPGSVITGNFNDFLIKYIYDTAATSGSQRGVIERLTLINTHATGGGIRYATCTGGTIRDCIVTANRGVNTTIDNLTWIAFEVSIFNCHFDPGANRSGSLGALLGSDGPVANCTFTNLEVGARHTAGQGAANFQGCTFELCDIGFAPGATPTTGSVQNFAIQGCHFPNCGTAIYFSRPGGYALLTGLYIEAADDAVSDYGIRTASDNASGLILAGVTVEGQYAVAAMTIAGGSANNRYAVFAGIGASNAGAGTAWGTMPVTGTTGKFIECNTPHVITTVPSGAGNVFEGDTYNVSNSDTAIWGATYATGAPNNHVKVRYNGTNWTVVGK